MRRRARHYRVCAALCGSAYLTLVAGCQSPAASRQQLRALSPLDRARAVVAVTADRDLAAVHKLVDLLSDPDDGVRMYAILALRRICADDYGYRYYDPPGVRGAAVARWRDALRQGEVRLRSATSANVPRPPLTRAGPVDSQTDEEEGAP